jgi:hypothetical protein
MTAYQTRLRILIAVDAFLAIAIVLGFLFSPGSSDSRSTSFDLLESVDAISSIAIEGPDAVQLVRAGALWTMTAPDGTLPADGARIESFLKAVDSVSHKEPVARDKASWPVLGLEGPSARRVTLMDSKGAIERDFLVGNYAPSPGAVYFALSDGPEAYSVASGMASYIMGKRSSWLDLRVWTAPPATESVQQLTVSGILEGADGSVQTLAYTATRSGSGWVSDGIALDSARVEAMVRALAALRGDDYAPASEPAGQAVVAVELKLGNGRSLNLSVEDKRGDGRYPALSSQRDRRIYLPSWSLTEVLKPLDQLKAAAGS